jgi:hypothetical protein
MRTLIQKELREHGILALIALGVGAVLLIPAYQGTADGRATGYNVMDGRVTGRLAPEDAGKDFLRPTYRGPVGVWKDAQTLLTESAVYRVESDARSQSVLFRAMEGDRILAAGQLALPKAREALVVATERRIVMVTAGGEIVWDMAYEPGQPDYTQIEIYALATPQEYGVIIAPSYQANQKAGWTLPSHAIWISEGAGVQRRVELPTLKWPEYKTTVGEVVMSAFLPPPFVAAVTRAYPHDARAAVLPLSLGGSVLCAVVGWWFGCRQGLSTGRQVGWAGFHLLFGLPGLLASLSVQEWPVREPCPECKRKRPIDEAKCRHCGAGFESPGRNGTEIFEPLPGQAAESR